MAYTQTETPKRGFFSNLANPVLRRMEKNAECGTENVATYSGIVGKTVFFLLMTMVGDSACFFIHNLILQSGTRLVQVADSKNGIYDFTAGTADLVIMGIVLLVSLIMPFLAWFLRKTTPVTGSIYCVAQGFLIGYITVALAPQYKFISVLAMLITLTLVGGMLFVYAKRIIRVTARFRGVIIAIFFSIVLSSLIFFLLSLIPAIRNTDLFMGVSGAINTPGVSIGISIVFVIIAALFLLVDFDTIERCVENGVDKQYEWMAAWGLAYTVIYIYFKVLRILLMIFGRGGRSSSRF